MYGFVAMNMLRIVCMRRRRVSFGVSGQERKRGGRASSSSLLKKREKKKKKKRNPSSLLLFFLSNFWGYRVAA